MIARLEVDVERGASRVTICVLDRDYLGVLTAELRVIPLTENLSVFYDESADDWIRCRLAPSLWRQRFDDVAHVRIIGRC